MKEQGKYFWAGAAAGLANGLFGGGGGAVLLPILTRFCGLPQQKALATSVAIVLPLCLFSAGLYWWQGNLDLGQALPYLLGGALGGWIGGKTFQKTNPQVLRQGFALLVIWSGARWLLSSG